LYYRIAAVGFVNIIIIKTVSIIICIGPTGLRLWHIGKTDPQCGTVHSAFARADSFAQLVTTPLGQDIIHLYVSSLIIIIITLITTLNFISELNRRICVHTGDARETSYLF